MFAVHSCVLPPRNFRHAFNRPIHFDEWYSKFLGHGQLEKHPSSLLWCSSFTVHLWLEGGHPKEKVGYLHINVSAAVTFQLYALHLEYSFLSLSIQFFYSII